MFGYQQYWENSLKGLGNCCHYGVIPIEAITRYCVVDWDKRPELVYNYTDHSLSVEHYYLRGAFYKDVVKWFFGDRELLPADMLEAGLNQEIDEIPEMLKELYEMKKEQTDYRIKTSKNRNEIKVVKL